MVWSSNPHEFYTVGMILKSWQLEENAIGKSGWGGKWEIDKKIKGIGSVSRSPLKVEG